MKASGKKQNQTNLRCNLYLRGIIFKAKAFSVFMVIAILPVAFSHKCTKRRVDGASVVTDFQLPDLSYSEE